MENRRDIALASGVNLHILHTEQFHSGYFSVQLLRPLQKACVSRDSLLMPVLSRGTRRLPDLTRISAALEELYGASLSPAITQYGETMSIGFHAAFPDDRFLPGEENHLERMISMTGDMLLDPATRGGLLQDKFVRTERQNLHDRILANVNNKRGYARIRARALLFEQEPYGIYPLGTAEEALKQHYQSLTKHYRKILAEAPMELYYCGGAEPARVEDAVRKAFRSIPGSGERLLETGGMHSALPECRRVTEEMDVEQGILVLGFRFTGSERVDGPTLAVLNEMLGGGPASRLFRNVREARSLCYEIGSSAERYKKSMMVQAGISFDQAEAVEEAILTELEQLQTGGFTDAELETARQSVFTSYRMGLDDPSAMCSFQQGQNLLGEAADLRQCAVFALEISREEIQKLAGRLKQGLCYFLKKGDGE